jgi:hypothetical protein
MSFYTLTFLVKHPFTGLKRHKRTLNQLQKRRRNEEKNKRTEFFSKFSDILFIHFFFLSFFAAKDNDSNDQKASIFSDGIDQELLGSENLSDDGALDIDNLPAMNSMFDMFSLNVIL